MAVDGISNSGSTVPIVDPSKTGFAGLNSETFMKLLITQLQNQDPLEPVGNEELLNQLSMMRNLQSNIELGDALKSITSNQQLSTAASFIGKEVVGSADESQVTGVVNRAFVREGIAYVGIGDDEVPLSSVTDVTAVE